MFLVCGEALFDMFLDDAPPASRALRFTARVGGSPFNVAVGLAQLGARAALLTALSDDFLGDRLAAVLAAEGVSLEFLRRRARPTTLGFVALSESGEARYAFYGEGAADRGLESVDLPPRLDGVSALHLGSYSLVTPPTCDALAALARREAGRRLISIDPNLRPNVEPDLELWRARIAELAALADLLKLSAEDAALLYPGLGPEQAMARLLDAGAGLVILTHGAAGARAISASGAARVPAWPVSVADTVGAGDSFQAAALYDLGRLGALQPGAPARLEDAALERLLRFASAAAAHACARRGAESPTLPQIDALLSEAAP